MSRAPGKRARAYHSPSRHRQAEETRRRITDAARTLLVEKGFDGTTIEAIAREAGVAVQTVYAIFGSKRGIVAGLMDRARFGPEYAEQVSRVREAVEPAPRLALTAGVARRVHDAERSVLDLLRGAGVVAPELAAMAREREHERYDGQGRTIQLLVEQRRLRADLDATAARDVLWALTGHEPYRLLVIERQWSPDRYERWLGELLQTALLSPAPRKRGSKAPGASPRGSKKGRP
jgi:AcrR family transcriptional regulator